MKNFLRVVLLTLVVILSNEVSMARIIGVKNIPTAKVDLSQGLETGYYLLKQVNDNNSAAGTLLITWLETTAVSTSFPLTIPSRKLQNAGILPIFPINTKKPTKVSSRE